MTTNPFRYSGPVGAEDLIDRDGETARLVEGALEGNNSRVVAPRRFGKTSLLRRVMAEVQARGWEAVYVDFFGVVTLADVAERVERSYTAALTGGAARWFEGVRRALRPEVHVGVPGVSVGAELQAPATSPLLDRLALPKKVHERFGRRVLVVFDEFQGVLTAQPNADAVIRSEIQHHGEAASYVFAGSQVGMMEALFTDRRRAFYAQARPVELPPLPGPETAEYIASRFTATGRDVGHALGPLLDVAAGHPQRTMLLAHALWAATPEGATAGEDRVAEVVDRVTAELLGEFTVVWSSLATGQRRLLALVASNTERPYSRISSIGGSKGSAVRSGLNALLERGEIVRDPARLSGYRVVDPLLARWVRDGRPASS
ncbi:MAG: AAA family ATPase [Acidimicrobiales bacterium]